MKIQLGNTTSSYYELTVDIVRPDLGLDILVLFTSQRAACKKSCAEGTGGKFTKHGNSGL